MSATFPRTVVMGPRGVWRWRVTVALGNEASSACSNRRLQSNVLIKREGHLRYKTIGSSSGCQRGVIRGCCGRVLYCS